MPPRNIVPSANRFENSKEWQESIAIVAAGLDAPPQTERELYVWLRALTGEPIPYKKVCPHHGTPWDMIWEAYRVDLPNQTERPRRMEIAVGPRDGQKTLSLAKLCVAELLLKPGCETCVVAAVDLQAKRCTRYMRRYLAHPATRHLVGRAVANEINCHNGARYEQLVGGTNALNSPHPHKLRTDEVEMVKSKADIEDMKMMPTTYGGINQHQLYCSTRKYIKGNMSNLIAEARPSSTKIMTWCWKEMSEPCPDSRSGTKKEIYEVPDLMHPGETLVVEAFEGCRHCDLLPSCRGDLKRSRGNFPIDESIENYRKMSREGWLVQKECIEPTRADMFFEDWDETKQVGDYGYNPKLPLDLSIDFSGGGQDPTSIGFWQTDGQNQFRVHELIYHRKVAAHIGQGIQTWCKDRGVTPAHMVGDSAQKQFIMELQNWSPFFHKLRPTRKVARKDGLQLCKRFVRDTTGVRRLFVNRTCPNFIEEINHAHRKDSDPDDLTGDDHSLDDWRYWTVERFFHGAEPRIRWLDPYAAPERSSEESPVEAPKTEAVPPRGESDISDTVNRYLGED